MSITSEITRLTNLRNRLRTKLVALGLVASNATLSDCVDAAEGVTGKAAQTYTPTTTDQIITAGQYLSGAQTVAGDANLIPANIASGVNIFGIQGTHEGGGSVSVPEKDVNFIDYDGTILYSYSKAQFASLTALPANPTHTGLTAQGWNWSLADAKAYVAAYGKLWVGQMYITNDGKTRIYIKLEEGRLAPYLGIAISGTATVDWGDGSTDTVRGNSTSTVVNTQHIYAAAGEYVIAIAATGSMVLSGHSTYGSQVLWKNVTTSHQQNRVYQNAVRCVEIGRNCAIGAHAFGYCNSLASITIPNSVTSIGTYAFRYTYGLASITIPNSVTSIGTYAFRYTYGLASIAIPSSVKSIEDYAFSSCNSLASITIPSGVTSFGTYAFQGADSLTSITIPSGVTSLGMRTFSDCYGLGYIRFTRTTPPTVANSNAWSGVSTDCIIYVPRGTLSTYKSATNYPNSSTYTYREYDP